MTKSNNDIKTQSDQDLLTAFRKSNEIEYLGTLYHRYMHLVYGLCLKYLKSREESQDAVMSIFEQIADKLQHQEVTYFKSWLYIVARNYCLMSLRKRSSQKEYNELVMETEAVVHHNEEYRLDGDLETLEECLKNLKGKQQACVSLFYLKEKSYEDITIETSFSLKEVKSHIQNGKRNLKICLESKHVKG